ncbi:hypothetical protein KUCAC02_034720, partial [Chaenocephalus aceratus]
RHLHDGSHSGMLLFKTGRHLSQVDLQAARKGLEASSLLAKCTPTPTRPINTYRAIRRA